MYRERGDALGNTAPGIVADSELKGEASLLFLTRPLLSEDDKQLEIIDKL